ncbi:MAG: lipoate--protein ligase family protein [Thermoanaerobaculaceae bacterium]|nr:lipoate--protein ligase family protein [Thermoanaerobaculaceae bacterium]
MNFRFIRDKARKGSINMAVDEYFYSLAENGNLQECVIRIFRWSPPALSLGYHQKYETSADEEFLKERGVDIVRRPTGGKAVLHAEELTYSVVSSLSYGYFEGNTLDQTYEKIALALKKSLEFLGMKPELEKRETKLNVLHPAPCFLVPTKKEILVDGKKVIGSAQKRGANAFLQHGSIPIKMDYELLARATKNSLQEIPSFRKHFAALSEFCPDLDEAKLENALHEGFKSEFKGIFVEKPLEEKELIEAEKIAKEKYDSEKWNKKPY